MINNCTELDISELDKLDKLFMMMQGKWASSEHVIDFAENYQFLQRFYLKLRFENWADFVFVKI